MKSRFNLARSFTSLLVLGLVPAVPCSADSPVMNWRSGSLLRQVTDIQYSPNGQRLLTAGSFDVRLYRTSDRVLMWAGRDYSANNYGPVSIARDGSSFFVCITGKKIERRSLENGTLLETLPFAVYPVDMVAVSATKIYYNTSNGLFECQKSGSTWTQTWSWTTGCGTDHNMEVSPNGQYAVVASGTELIKVFDTVTKSANPVATLDLTASALRLAFSPNGQWLGVSNGGSGIRLISTSNWSLARTVSGSYCGAVGFYPDNDTVGIVRRIGTDTLVYQRYTVGGSQIDSSEQMLTSDDMGHLAISQVNEQAAFSSDNDVLLRSKDNTPAGQLPGLNALAKFFDYSYDDSRVFAASDREVLAFDTTTGSERLRIPSASTIFGLGSGGGSLCVATSGFVRLYNQSSGASIVNLTVSVNNILGALANKIAVSKGAFGSSGAVLAVPTGSAANLYKASNGTGITSVNAGGTCYGVAFSKNSSRLFTFTSSSLRIWNPSNLVSPEGQIPISTWEQFEPGSSSSSCYLLKSDRTIQEYVRGSSGWQAGRVLPLSGINVSPRIALSADGSRMAVFATVLGGTGSKIDLYSLNPWQKVLTYDANIGLGPIGGVFSTFDQYMAFGDYWTQGCVYQVWNPYRSADAWVVNISPPSVSRGQSTTGTVRLTAPAPEGGLTVTLSSGDSATAWPAVTTLTFSKGESSKDFAILTSPNGTGRSVAINARFRRQATGVVSIKD